MEVPHIESPCQLICRLDLKSGLCIGCGRSREEIARWTRYSAQERQNIMETLPERLPPLRRIYERLKTEGKI